MHESSYDCLSKDRSLDISEITENSDELESESSSGYNPYAMAGMMRGAEQSRTQYLIVNPIEER